MPEINTFYKSVEIVDLQEELWALLGGDLYSLRKLINTCPKDLDFWRSLVITLFQTLSITANDLGKSGFRTLLKQTFAKFETGNSVGWSEIGVNVTNAEALRIANKGVIPNNPTVAFIFRIGLHNLDLQTIATVKERELKLKSLLSSFKEENERIVDNDGDQNVII